jgi:hypothetical protein
MSELLDFGQATEAMKKGKKVAREGWNDKGKWLILLPAEGTSINIENPSDDFTLPQIVMQTTHNKVVPWPEAKTDVLMEDWQIAD